MNNYKNQIINNKVSDVIPNLIKSNKFREK